MLHLGHLAEDLLACPFLRPDVLAQLRDLLVLDLNEVVLPVRVGLFLGLHGAVRLDLLLCTADEVTEARLKAGVIVSRQRRIGLHRPGGVTAEVHVVKESNRA